MHYWNIDILIMSRLDSKYLWCFTKNLLPRDSSQMTLFSCLHKWLSCISEEKLFYLKSMIILYLHLHCTSYMQHVTALVHLYMTCYYVSTPVCDMSLWLNTCMWYVTMLAHLYVTYHMLAHLYVTCQCWHTCMWHVTLLAHLCVTWYYVSTPVCDMSLCYHTCMWHVTC